MDATPLSSDATSLPDDPVILQRMIRELLATLDERDRENEGLRHRLDLLLKRLYGPRAERYNPDQPVLFTDLAEAVPAEALAAPPAVPEVSAPSRNGRQGHGRKTLPKHLRRERIVHDLPLAQRHCPGCGQEQAPIGEDISEQLDYQPSSLFVVQHVRPKYACPHCRQGVAAEAKPAQPIDKGLPGPGLLAQVAVSKYADHLPLYRLERVFARQGVDLARSTMCGWMAECAALLRPVYQLMVERVLASRVVHTDDTTMPVQDPDRDRTKTGRLWVYLGDPEHPYQVFDYTPTHERTGPGQFLKNFRGYLQADAFSGYDGIYLTQPVVEVACNAHARRKFYEARTSDEALSHQALAYYRQLYDVERQAKAREEQEKRPLSDDERKAWRQEKAVPILAALESWLQEQKPKVLPKSPMGQAISYALNHWQALKRYTEAGFLAIDNNVAEREMKRIAIGRKNWLFAGSDEGGRTAAVLFSFTSTCYRHRLDPFVYLRDLLRRLPAHGGASLEEFLPDRWQIAPATPAATDSS